MLTAGIVVTAVGIGLMFGGPLGVLVVGMVLVGFGLVKTGAGVDTRKFNCPKRDARNDRTRAFCHYCDASLPEK